MRLVITAAMRGTTLLILIPFSQADTECVAFCGRGQGGLNNYMAYVNGAYAYAHRKNLRFLATAIDPPSRVNNISAGEFADLFGAREWRCDAPRDPNGATAVRELVWTPSERYDAPDAAALDRGLGVARAWRTSDAVEGCDAVLQWAVDDKAGRGFVSFDYSSSRDFFRRRYRAARAAPPRPPRDVVDVVVHYRLGDVASATEADLKHVHDHHRNSAYEFRKRSTPARLAPLVAVLERTASLGPWALACRVVSDSPEHAEVAALEAALARFCAPGAAPGPSARAHLDALASADVAVCRSSGFCHFAAVLSDGVVLGSKSHQLPPSFGNVVGLRHGLGNATGDGPVRRAATQLDRLLRELRAG